MRSALNATEIAHHKTYYIETAIFDKLHHRQTMHPSRITVDKKRRCARIFPPPNMQLGHRKTAGDARAVFHSNFPCTTSLIAQRRGCPKYPRVMGLLWTWAFMSSSKVRINLAANVSAESASAFATWTLKPDCIVQPSTRPAKLRETWAHAAPGEPGCPK